MARNVPAERVGRGTNPREWPLSWNYPRDILEHVLEYFTTNYAAPGLVSDKRLPTHEEIAGLSLDGIDKAYPLSVLKKQSVITTASVPRHRRHLRHGCGPRTCARPSGGQKGHRSDSGRQRFVLSEGMRWTWAGHPLTDDTPPLQQVWIERQWWLGWVHSTRQSSLSGSYLTKHRLGGTICAKYITGVDVSRWVPRSQHWWRASRTCAVGSTPSIPAYFECQNQRSEVRDQNT